MTNRAAFIARVFFVFAVMLCDVVGTTVAVERFVPDSGSIQAAIDASSDNDIVTVRDGVYTGDGNYDIDFKGLSITLRSQNGPDNCIVDCEGKGRAFIFTSGEDSDSVLQGLTVINAAAWDPDWPQDPNDPNDMSDPAGYGGAIYCLGSSPKITDCIITDCTADYAGGAIFCDLGSDLLITDSVISYNFCGSYNYDINQGGGGIYCRDSDPNIQSCTLSYNWAQGAGGAIALIDSNSVITGSTMTFNDAWADNDEMLQHGGGVYCKGGKVTIAECKIKENDAKWSGGGIAIADANSTIELCEILDNHSWASAGGVYMEGYPPEEFSAPNEPNLPGDANDSNEPNEPVMVTHNLLKNCVIANNWGYWSGGVSSDYGSAATIENCTITNNVASYSYQPIVLVGGLECYGGTAQVINSIIWGNTGPQIQAAYGNIIVTYSDVGAGDVPDDADPNTFIIDVLDGEGNINADPLFADPVRRDYHLQSEFLNGRYNPYTGIFDANDPNTSPCINAGDPDSDWSEEPAPNGDRINMGAYGNTDQASKSDIFVPVPGDLDHDGDVDMVDLAILTDNWLLWGSAIINSDADINNDGIVNFEDMAILLNKLS